MLQLQELKARLEWKAYLEAIHDVSQGLESARVMLACGVQRIEDDQR